MKTNLSLLYMILFIIGTLTVACLFGCSSENIDDEGSVEEEDGGIANRLLNEDSEIPTITIKEIQREKIDEVRVIGAERWSPVKVKWHLSASPAPKTDLAVMGKFRGQSPGWVIIPKSQNHSETFSDIMARGEIEIYPLPVLSIVGKGLEANLKAIEKHQGPLPVSSRAGHIIPKDYDFPLYKVGEPSALTVKGELLGLVAQLVSSNPPAGGKLMANASLVITFSAAPENVTINGKPATVAGRTATLAGPHTPGQTAFAIAWDNGPGGAAGSATINLNVVAPDTVPPTITRRNFQSKDADPEPLNKDGVVIEFSEPIAKHSLKLTLEDGTDLGWLPRVDGARITFKPLRGKELGIETTYIIRGRVEDAAGNRTVIRVVFVTRLKE